MLTTDLALLKDPVYRDIVESFANDVNVLNNVFGAVWRKLMENGGRWATTKHCIDPSDLIANSFDTCQNLEKSTMPKVQLMKIYLMKIHILQQLQI